jgi:hypothetical protein
MVRCTSLLFMSRSRGRHTPIDLFRRSLQHRLHAFPSDPAFFFVYGCCIIPPYSMIPITGVFCYSRLGNFPLFPFRLCSVILVYSLPVPPACAVARCVHCSCSKLLSRSWDFTRYTQDVRLHFAVSWFVRICSSLLLKAMLINLHEYPPISY